MLKTFYGDAARIHTKQQTEVKKRVCICVCVQKCRYDTFKRMNQAVACLTEMKINLAE